MAEHKNLRRLHEAEGNRGTVEVQVGGEWWVLRANPRGMLWISRPGRAAIHAVPSTRGDSFRKADMGDQPELEEAPPVIALGPDEEQPDEPEASPKPLAKAGAAEDDAPEAKVSRRKGRATKSKKEQLKLFG